MNGVVLGLVFVVSATSSAVDIPTEVTTSSEVVITSIPVVSTVIFSEVEILVDSVETLDVSVSVV